jgi:hypothetical protein
MAAVLAVLLWNLPAAAQVLTGTIIGTVRDESRAVLPGATVTLTSPALPGGPRTEVTNEQGEYRFPQLPPGSYELNITLQGFTTYDEHEIPVTVGATVDRDVALKVAAVAETITVSGAAPVVDPRRTGVIESLSKEVIEAVPQNRQGGI